MIKFPNKKYFKFEKYFNDYSKELIKCINDSDVKKISIVNKLLKKKYMNGNNIFVCGNGGSAAIANHFECDHKKINAQTIKNLKKMINGI